jgi:Ca-activated chloride channel family protein
VIVGRYKKPGVAKISISGKVGSDAKKFDFPADFAVKSSDGSFGFVEKLWATRRIGEIIDQIDLHGKNAELVKELVELSTKHGILTPYTSFLADENSTRSFALSERLEQAESRLDRLSTAEGKAGVAQRATKGGLQNAFNAPAPASAGAGGAVYREIDSDKDVRLKGIKQNSNETVYARRVADGEPGKKGRQVLVTPETAQMDLEKDKAQIKTIERFSEEYFALVRDNTIAENQILALQEGEEELLVKLRGQAYLVK